MEKTPLKKNNYSKHFLIPFVMDVAIVVKSHLYFAVKLRR